MTVCKSHGGQAGVCGPRKCFRVKRKQENFQVTHHVALSPPPIAPEVTRNHEEEARCQWGQGGRAGPKWGVACPVGRGLPSAPVEERRMRHQGRHAAHPC